MSFYEVQFHNVESIGADFSLFDANHERGEFAVLRINVGPRDEHVSIFLKGDDCHEMARQYAEAINRCNVQAVEKLEATIRKLEVVS